jgi:DNA-binding SARP family transcriptional activator
VWFGVLGRLEVRGTDGSGVAISGPARRRLLAALVSRAGRPASAAALIDDLWGESPPRSALMSLRTHVLRLRAELASAGAETVLVTAGDGYQLCVDAEDIDANRFAALVEQAHRCAEPRRAIERYDEALALWRDEAYFEFGDASFAVDERVRLAELRAKARERRTDLGLS